MSAFISQLKQHVIDEFVFACARAFGSKPESGVALDFPPNVVFGDFAIACFSLAKQFKKNPKEIAFAIASAMNPTERINSVSADGPYVNITLSPAAAFNAVCGDVAQEGGVFGNSSIGAGEKVMVEYLSPNTNKPLHLGHVRNGVLGMAVSRILEAAGHRVVKANLINDRGVHICKSMLAYQRWGDSETPESVGKKGDHFVGDLYVLYSKKEEELPGLEQEVQAMLLQWEKGDHEVVNLWKRKIAQAAIKFYLARVNPSQIIHFDPKESISFEGETGPYCQYSYARCQRILRKAAESELSPEHADFSKLGNEEERDVLRILISFPNAVERAAQQFNPGIVCGWAYDCARAINRFYQKHKVIDLDADAGLVGARLQIIQATSQALKNGLYLLGIETVDEM